MKEATAWDLIGWDDGRVRIKGGRATYEAVMYNCATGGRMVKLARLDTSGGRLREVSRYVEPDATLEVLDDEAFANWRSEFGIR